MANLVLTEGQFLLLGLLMGGYDADERAIHKTNLARFKSIFGLLPHVYAKLWEDLLTTDLVKAHLGTDTVRPSPRNVLIAVNFLKCYQTEKSKSGHLGGVCENTARKWTWYYAKKIATLVEAK
eukprot:scaffold527520_cov106-Attheya_sp.AAC.1